MDTTRVLGSHYRLGRLIGRGAMGEVFTVTDLDSGRELAAKILRSEHTENDEVTARFLLERRVLRELTHPNIVRVRELVVDRDDIAIIMDLVDGSDVRHLLREQGRLAPEFAVRLCADVLAALAMAHGQEPAVHHRDVKPDNILVGRVDQHVYLTDFGVARLAEVGTGVRPTAGVGTADYMAPEMGGQVAGAAADVYAVGITLYELLAGHTPFGTDGYQAVALRHVICQPPPIAGMPPALAELLASMLVKRPESRPDAATAEHRLRDLIPSLRALPPLAATPVPVEWTPVANHLRSGAAAGSQAVDDAAGEQMRATRLRGATKPAEELPVAAVPGAVLGRIDAPSVRDLGRETNLVDRASIERERDAAEALAGIGSERVPTGGSRRRNLVVGISVAAVCAVAAGIFVASTSGDNESSGRTGSKAPVTVQTVEITGGTKTYATPLSVTRSAAYDSSAKELTVTLDFSASAALAGPFLEVVPPSTKGRDCPAVTPGSGVELSTYVGDGNIGCAVSINPPGGRLANRQQWSATYTLTFDGGSADHARDTISRWFTAASASLDAALQSFGRSSALFASQRYNGFEPVLTGDVVAGASIPIVVNPLWVGSDQADNNHPLYSSTSGSAQSLASDLGLPVTIEAGAGGCGSASLSQRGGTAAVSSSTTGCNVDVRVGGDVHPLPQFSVSAG